MDDIVHTDKGLTEIINSLPVAVVIINTDKRVVLVNKIIEDFTQRDRADIIGKTGGEAFGCVHANKHPNGCGHAEACKLCDLRKIVLNTMETKESKRLIEISLDFVKVGKRELRVSTKYINLLGKEAVLLSMEDITEAKQQQEDKLKAVQLNTALETVGGITHELAQPLMVVLGYADLILEGLDEGNPLYNHITAISQNSKRLGGLVRDLQNITAYKNKEYLGPNSKIIDVKASTKGD